MRKTLLAVALVLATFLPIAAEASQLQDCIALKCDKGCAERCAVKAAPGTAAHRRCMLRCRMWHDKCVAKCKYKFR